MLVYAPTNAPSKAPATMHRRLTATALERRGIRPVARPHAELTLVEPVIAGRAWLEISDGWDDATGSEPSTTGVLSPSRVEVWLEGVNPGKRYLVTIEVVCLVGATDARFDVSSSATVDDAFVVGPLDRTLMVVVAPSEDLEVVILEPHHLSLWSLTAVTIFGVS
jgi:hypothetical protein